MPWPMRFGPEPRIITLGVVAAADLVDGPALPARVVVRRLGGELGGAGVDGLEASARPRTAPRDRAPAPGARAGTSGSIAVRLVRRPRPTRRGGRPRAARRSGRRPGSRRRSSSSPSSPATSAATSSSRERIALRERLLEGAADRHHLPHALHVRGQAPVDARELLEREARPLDDHVVDRRLEARGRRARDVVGDLVERVADRQPRGDLGDREAGRLRGQRARTATRAGSSR